MATSAEMLTLAAASFVSGVLSVIAVTGTWKMRSYGLYAFALMVPIGLLHSFGVFSNEQTTLGVMGIVNWLILLATITYLIGLKSGGQLDRTT